LEGERDHDNVQQCRLQRGTDGARQAAAREGPARSPPTKVGTTRYTTPTRCTTPACYTTCCTRVDIRVLRIMCDGTAPPLANGEFSMQYFTIGPPATTPYLPAKTPYLPATTPYLPATTLGRRKPTNDIRFRKDRQTKNNPYFSYFFKLPAKFAASCCCQEVWISTWQTSTTLGQKSCMPNVRFVAKWL
jgi:hypothetical protein